MEDVGDTQLPNMMFLTKVFSGLTALTSSPCWMKKMTLGHFPMSSHTPQCQTNSKTNLLSIDGWRLEDYLGKPVF